MLVFCFSQGKEDILNGTANTHAHTNFHTVESLYKERKREKSETGLVKKLQKFVHHPIGVCGLTSNVYRIIQGKYANWFMLFGLRIDATPGQEGFEWTVPCRDRVGLQINAIGFHTRVKERERKRSAAVTQRWKISR